VVSSRSPSATLRIPPRRSRVLERSSDRTVWRCVAGHNDWIGTRIIFALKPPDDGGTALLFTHEGWQQEKEFMNGLD
jgi:hypothetical protein